MDQKLLGELETFVRDRRYNESAGPLFQILNAIEAGSKSDLKVPSEADATRLAAAITQILTDTSIPFSRGMFFEMNRFKRCITQVFQVSGYRGTSHFIKMLGKMNEKGSSTYNVQDLIRLFTGLSINAMNMELCDAFLRIDPKWSFPVAIGFLSEQLLFTRKAKKFAPSCLRLGISGRMSTQIFIRCRKMGDPYFQ